MNWYGHAMERDGEHNAEESVEDGYSRPRKRKRGRPKTSRKDACQRDLKSTGLIAGEETEITESR